MGFNAFNSFIGFPPANKNAHIESRVSRNGKLRTETVRRDENAVSMAVTTDPKTNATRLFIDNLDFVGDLAYDSLSLSGREARTLYRLLKAHYEYADKPL